jgi:hypothetical protein
MHSLARFKCKQGCKRYASKKANSDKCKAGPNCRGGWGRAIHLHKLRYAGYCHSHEPGPSPRGSSGLGFEGSGVHVSHTRTVVRVSVHLACERRLHEPPFYIRNCCKNSPVSRPSPSYRDFEEACEVLWCPANFGMLGQEGGTAAPVYVMQRFSWNVFAPAGDRSRTSTPTTSGAN